MEDIPLNDQYCSTDTEMLNWYGPECMDDRLFTNGETFVSLINSAFVWDTKMGDCMSGAGKESIWLSDCCIFETQQGGAGHVMIWSGFSLREKSPVVFVNGNMNDQHYIDEILDPVVHPIVGRVDVQFVLMDDDACPHMAHIVKDYLHA